MTHSFHPSVLREYDIRGIVGDTLTVNDAVALGRSFATHVLRQGGKTICVGYDGRLTSPELSEALRNGMVSSGVHVIEIGRGPTPMLYFSVYHLKADAGVMVTGSHNPPDYNGFKMMLKSGPVYGDMILNLGKMAGVGDWDSQTGTYESIDIKSAYVQRLVQDYKGTHPLTCVWDAGNGAAGDIIPELISHLPGHHHILFGEVDGTFPNHHPDPTVEKNLEDLKRAVEAHKADLGIAFDGDGDRIGAIDGIGRVVWGDQLLALYARDVLRDNPGATIIADVKASSVLFNEVARLGGNPLMWKTGHSLIKAKMKETNSKLAGEMSGHIFFADKYYGFDDALYCGVRLLSLVSQSGKTLSGLYDELPKTFSTPEMRIEVDESRKFKIIEQIQADLAKDKNLNINAIDGVRVTTPNGWWLLRASNTQPVLVARAEANSEAALQELQALLEKTLEQYGVTLKLTH